MGLTNGKKSLPQLLYAQVVKQYRRKRVVGVHHRVVFGTLEAVEHVLAACGWKINTSFIERLNLDIRQRVAAVGRRVNTLCQGEAGLQHQLALFHVYYNFVLAHGSLRQPLQAPASTNGRGLSQGVAAVYTRDGRRIDGSRVEAPRSAPVSRAAVAAIPCGVRRSQRENARAAGRTRVLTIRSAGLQEVLTTPVEG